MVTVSTHFDVFAWELRHSYPWVESHMWLQRMWDQSSSRGHFGLLTFGYSFLKNGQWYVCMELEHNDPWVDSHIWS